MQIPEKILEKLPYKCSGLICSLIVNQIQMDEVTNKFPPKLLAKINDGAGFFGSGCTITKKDVINLNDDAMSYVIKLIDPFI